MKIRSADPAALLQLPPSRRMLDAQALLVYLSAVHYSLADALLITSAQDIRCLNEIDVEPYVHQVENLKQFVNHYQPRMMLFDEVGQGKTISAGLILAETYSAKTDHELPDRLPGHFDRPVERGA